MKWLLPWWVRKVFKFCIKDHCSSSLTGEGEKILSSLFILFVCFHIKKKFFFPSWMAIRKVAHPGAYRFSVYRLMVCLFFFPKLLLSERKTHSLTCRLSTGEGG